MPGIALVGLPIGLAGCGAVPFARTGATPLVVTSLAGKRVALPQGKPLVLYFMSAQCGSCVQGEQQLAQLQGQMPSDVHIISLDVSPGYDTPQMVMAIARSVGAGWPQMFATNAVLNAYHVTQLDQVVVMAASGRVVYNGGLPSSGQLLTYIRTAAST